MSIWILTAEGWDFLMLLTWGSWDTREKMQQLWRCFFRPGFTFVFFFVVVGFSFVLFFLVMSPV